MIFNSIVQQIHPQFVAQRSLYEARERPSKAYSWVAFMLSQILVEFPWMLVVAVLSFVTWYSISAGVKFGYSLISQVLSDWTLPKCLGSACAQRAGWADVPVPHELVSL
jgi:ABC-type multidrug transport system permease subunit